ncbi:MAG: lipoprotein-releasing ABC transporter permease subunit [Parvularculales bacterium]
MTSKTSTRPFSAFEWSVALRYLRARRKEGFISVIAWFSLIGIALGVATLIIVMAVMNGFRSELLGRILGVNGHIMIYGVEGRIPDYNPLIKQVQGVDGVIGAVPVVEGQVLLATATHTQGVLVRGMREDDLRSLPLITDNIVGGSLNDFDIGNGVLVGARLAKSLRVNVGDNVTLYAPQGTSTPFGTMPRVGNYPITGLFEIGMSDIDGGFIYMSLEEAQSFFNAGASAGRVSVMIDDPDQVSVLRASIGEAVGPNYFLSDWKQANSALSSALEVERNVMFLILTLIIVVASLNIISGLIMLVKDKGRDIAVLRSMGATQGMIMRIFFLAGASIGITGSVTGFILGVTFCLNIETLRQWLSQLSGTEIFSPEVYYLSSLPAEMDPVQVFWILTMALGLSFMATLYPARRAARLDPVEALRYE